MSSICGLLHQTSSHTPIFQKCIIALILGFLCLPAAGMGREQIAELRQETEEMFYHGFTNYMTHAFPEDELRPVSCKPLTRDRRNPAHVELNDVLGNYSLTLVDSLSTLAILASSEAYSLRKSKNRPLDNFQNGVKDLVEQYGDGSDGEAGIGLRANAFNLDSKVQVFETVIRGVGGLLSAHLFAVGDLPIKGYNPPEDQARFAKSWDRGGGDSHTGESNKGIRWRNGFVYDGQLLRLAHDLAQRLLPAFYTTTGLPYPRVNLKHGVSFYTNSPLNNAQVDDEQCHVRASERPEITETCSAGAGSLVLEFTTLSRLTGDARFEEAAKRAFWAVWSRRSNVGLIGSGVDAESGLWISPYTGIGAGIDSFFEYALKTYILLSGDSHHFDPSRPPPLDPHGFFEPLGEDAHDPNVFLQAWEEAHAAIKRHLFRGVEYQHPHYIQGDLYTGAIRATWIDSLSAYYPGLLTLAGEIDEAIATHLLATALWTRFSAIPERWNVATGNIEGGLGWWGGRPEFIESTYYLYRATQDPWYLHVGEMVLRDIKRRCWAKCGWSGLQDVRNGDKSDRMESFFLGETAKYMFLLFDPSHPLNSWDANFVFSTEGHPLILPKTSHPKTRSNPTNVKGESKPPTCPVPPPSVPFSVSATASRGDLFHAASLARLHLMPSRDTVESALVEFSADHPSISLSDLHSPSNYTFYPWTLPLDLVPWNGTSDPMIGRATFDISFPAIPNNVVGPGSLQRVTDGILVNSIGGLRLGMVQDIPIQEEDSTSGEGEIFRIHAINNLALGKDEKIYLSNTVFSSVLNPSDPHLTKVKDLTMLDIVADVEDSAPDPRSRNSSPPNTTHVDDADPDVTIPSDSSLPSNIKTALSSLISHVSSIILDQNQFQKSRQQTSAAPPSESARPNARIYIPGVIPTGPGAAPIPAFPEPDAPILATPPNPLPFTRIHFADTACSTPLPLSVPTSTQILVLRRGGCSFSQKIQNIPQYPPSASSLQLVIIISYDGDEDDDGVPNGDGWLIRPLLDRVQDMPSGLVRRNPIPLVMVGGGERTEQLLRRAQGIGVKRRYEMFAKGVKVGNWIII